MPKSAATVRAKTQLMFITLLRDDGVIRGDKQRVLYCKHPCECPSALNDKCIKSSVT